MNYGIFLYNTKYRNMLEYNKKEVPYNIEMKKFSSLLGIPKARIWNKTYRIWKIDMFSLDITCKGEKKKKKKIILNPGFLFPDLES